MNFWEKQTSDNDFSQSENLNEQISRMGSMSNEDLMKELFKVSSNMKAENRLSADDLERFYQTASMFLSSDQLVRLREIINLLK